MNCLTRTSSTMPFIMSINVPGTIQKGQNPKFAYDYSTETIPVIEMGKPTRCIRYVETGKNRYSDAKNQLDDAIG